MNRSVTIDDAHLMPADCLRKLRLLSEDFPRSHNLVLIGQPPLLQSLSLTVNEENRLAQIGVEKNTL